MWSSGYRVGSWCRMGNGRAFVLDICVIPVFVCGVFDNLDSSVGQGYAIFPRCGVPISNFGVREVFTCVFIIDRVTKSIIGRALKMAQKEKNSLVMMMLRNRDSPEIFVI